MPVNWISIDFEAAEWVYLFVANSNEKDTPTQGGGGFAAAHPEWVYVFHQYLGQKDIPTQRLHNQSISNSQACLSGYGYKNFFPEKLWESELGL